MSTPMLQAGLKFWINLIEMIANCVGVSCRNFHSNLYAVSVFCSHLCYSWLAILSQLFPFFWHAFVILAFAKTVFIGRFYANKFKIEFIVDLAIFSCRRWTSSWTFLSSRLTLRLCKTTFNWRWNRGRIDFDFCWGEHFLGISFGSKTIQQWLFRNSRIRTDNIRKELPYSHYLHF